MDNNRVVEDTSVSFEEPEIPLMQLPGSELCPVAALRLMVEKIPLGSQHPCFAKRDGTTWMYSQYQRKLKKVLACVGYDSSLFSSHSMRRGGCSFCFQVGVPAELIQIIGDWKTDIYKNYCHMELETRAQACALFRKELLKLSL